MPFDLPIGRALRRFRGLNAMKQGHVAELLKVSQATVSRRESGIAVSWRVDQADFVERSLWRFASPEILQAERAVADLVWFERPVRRYRFETGHDHGDETPANSRLMQWETLPLSDGRVGRLTTTRHG